MSHHFKMKYLLLILLSSCYTTKWVAIENKITVEGKHIFMKPTGVVKPVNDTVFIGYIIKQIKKPK